MVSKAREDLPEPLTPVTTVIALCGISTEMLRRLWTRAPRTRIASCSPSTVVSSLVAKGKPRRSGSRAPLKLHSIRLAENGRKRGSLRRLCGVSADFFAETFPKLGLLCEVDRPNATFDFEVDRHGRLAVGVVRVLIAIVLQTVCIDGADSAGCVDDHADILGQADVGFADAAFNVGGETRLAIAGEIDIHLAGADVQREASDINVSQTQVAVAGPHVDFDFKRNVIGEVKSPIVVGSRANMAPRVVLGNVQVSLCSGDRVIYLGGARSRAVVKVTFEKMAGATAEVQVAGAHLKIYSHALGILPVNASREMLHGVDGIAAPVGEVAAVPD